MESLVLGVVCASTQATMQAFAKVLEPFYTGLIGARPARQLSSLSCATSPFHRKMLIQGSKEADGDEHPNFTFPRTLGMAHCGRRANSASSYQASHLQNWLKAIDHSELSLRPVLATEWLLPKACPEPSLGNRGNRENTKPELRGILDFSPFIAGGSETCLSYLGFRVKGRRF